MGGVVDGGEPWVKSGRDGERKKKKKRRERCLGRRNKALSECGWVGGWGGVGKEKTVKELHTKEEGAEGRGGWERQEREMKDLQNGGST